MRLVQRGIANNFGLVGKNLRKYLATTALTATGLMIATSPAFADNWTDHVASEGSITIDTTVPNTTNIKQHTDFTKVSGDGDINAGWTVNVAQPSNNSKYVLYDIENDPTMIMGNLNANGKVYIFDQNGVVFGEGSQVNTNSIVVSTGHISDANIKADKHVFENVGGAGEIVNNGSITASEGGLAAFVAPAVRNNGVINAGVVVGGSANKVAIDLYGDNLVSIEVEGELENAIIENKGTINAAGGTVALTVAAAKDAVDNVINMEGIVDVSSVSSKGGKIVLNGGNKGVVKVAGKLKADGKTGGGSVKITGQNILATETSDISASATTHGDGGTVDLIAQNGLVYNGSIRAKGGVLGGKGGSVDTSGHGFVDIAGEVDVAAYNGLHGSWLIDPSNLTITDSLPTNVGGTGTEASPFKPDGDSLSWLRNSSIQNALNTGADVFITTVGTPDKGGQDGTITIASSITKSNGTESTLNFEAAGSIWLISGKTISATGDKILNVVMHALGGLPIIGGVVIDGAIKTNGGDVDLKADVNNIIIGNNGFIETKGGDIKSRASFFLPTGALGVPATGGTVINGYVDAQGGDVDMQQSGMLKAKADSVRTTDGGSITLSQNNLLGLGGSTIQSAIDAIKNGGEGKNTVNVGVGKYNESVEANVKNLVLNGAWHGYNPIFRVLVPELLETVIDPNSPGIHITADNVTVDGFVITGATGANGYGVWVDGADNAVVKNNIIHGNDSHGVFINRGSNGTTVRENRIYDLGTGIDSANGIFADVVSNLDIRLNAIDDIKGNGILVKQSGGLINVIGNFIGQLATAADVDGIWGDGIEINSVNGNTFVQSNVISNTYDETNNNTNDDSSGVYLKSSDNIVVGGYGLLEGNLITNVDWDGVKMGGGTGNKVIGNTIKNTTRIGIFGEGTHDALVSLNHVENANLDNWGAITLLGGEDHTISLNYVTGPTSGADSGIYLGGTGAGNNQIIGNIVHDIKGEGIEVIGVNDVTIALNSVTKTKGDAIRLRNSDGDLEVIANKIGSILNLHKIEGNGIYLSGIDGAVIKSNIIYNTQASNPYDGDDASGIYLDNVTNIQVGGTGALDGNFIRNADWDGIKTKNGGNHVIQGNNIAHSTRIGIYAENSTTLDILDNKVHDSNLDGWGGITVLGGSNHDIGRNKVSDIIGVSNADAGIHVQNAQGTDNNIFDNVIDKINGEGIEVRDSNNVDIVSNDITRTKGDGIQLVYSGGTLNVLDNNVGLESQPFGIEGNGIYLTGVHGGTTIQGNTIWNTKASNPYDGDDASGIYLDKVTNIRVGGLGEGQGNFIRNADWDGIKSRNGGDHIIEGNDIANSTRIGIYSENSTNQSILTNTVHNSNLDGWGGITVIGGASHDIIGNTVTDIVGVSKADSGIRVHYIQGDDNSISNNIVYNINGDGINGTEIVEYALISGNDIDDVAGDGIDINNFGSLRVENNDVRDAADNGILLQQGDYAAVVNNVGLGGTDNGVSFVGKNGIFLDTVVSSLIDNNEVEESGWDGIHVSNFNDTTITNNKIDRSGDDGIEAHDGHTVVIDGNEISESGVGAVIGDGEDEYEEYGGYDEFFGGHDGIHVRNIYGAEVETENEGEIEYAALLLGGSEPGTVRITNNKITVLVDSEEAESFDIPGVTISGDDGIEVVNVEGYVYIVGNNVANSGVGSDDVPFGLADEYGADGIHVRDVYLHYNGYTNDNHFQANDIGDGEYNIVVSGNVVDNSLDDGIEILGTGSNPRATGRVLVGGLGVGEGNTVTNSGWGNPSEGYGQSNYNYSGGDGIHVRGVYAYYGYGAGESEDGEFEGYAVDVLGNTVDQSGDDGIDVEWSSSTLIDNNTVTNSGWVGETDSEIPDDVFAILATGTGADEWGADGIFVNNVGEEYYGGYEKVSTLVEGPGDGYTEYSVVVRRNDVDNSLDDGIQVNNSLYGYGNDSKGSEYSIFSIYGYTAPVLIGGNNPLDGNTVTDSGNNGLYISGPGHDNVIVSGNAFARFDTGAKFESGLIDLTGATNTFNTGRIGLRFSPYGYSEGGELPYFETLDFYNTYLDLVDPEGDGVSTPYPTTPTNFGGTIGNQTFTGFKEEGDFYVYLDDGAFTNNGTPIWLSGLDSTYDDITIPSNGALTQEQFDFLEARFRHFPDPTASSTDIFWFGFVDENPLIEQSLIFNRFGVFNGDATGLNVRIVSLPFVPGGSNPTPSALNGISTFAGNNTPTDPANLNQIETAAGGDGEPTVPQNLNNIETASGDENESCWGNAVAAASGGQVVSVVYTGGFAANLNQAATCGTGF